MTGTVSQRIYNFVEAARTLELFRSRLKSCLEHYYKP